MREEDLHKKKSTKDNVVPATKMKGNERKDLSKLKFYTCGEYGHYVRKCLRKKKGDNDKKKEIVGVATSSSEMDDFSRRLEE